MSDSLAPGEIVAKLIDIGAAKSRHTIADLLIRVLWRGASKREAAVMEIAKTPSGSSISSRRGDVALKRKMPMRFSLIAAAIPTLFVCNVAMAQVDGQFDGTVTPTPTMSATSPLGIAAGSPTGIPLGSIEITSPGLSPVPTGVTGTITIPTTSSATTCSTVGTSPSEFYGSAASFDGGGMAVGAGAAATAANSGTTTPGTLMPLTTPITSQTPISSSSSGTLDTSGMSGTCGSGSSSLAASSAPTSSTSPTTPGGAARTGIPFGAFEIGNLGVSSTPAVPLPSVLPIASSLAPSSSAPTMPTISPATSSTTTPSNPACTPGGAIGPLSFAGEGNGGVTGTSMSARLLRQWIL